MSWHFLERWIEKANQHSTLIGKFWITFLIVCRMVIVASVGDRVYSDEQSEFKCNTLQPGCMNVCFNKFSPISHLRFWSFQILLVATPSVMFIIYSGHVPKKAKKKNKKVQKRKQSEPRKKRLDASVIREIEDEDEMNASNFNNNSNKNNNHSKSKKRIMSPGGVQSSRCDKDQGNKYGNSKRERKDKEYTKTNGLSPKVLTTLINYKPCTANNKDPIQTCIVNENHSPVQRKQLWHEMKLDSVVRIAEGNVKGDHDHGVDGMWRIPNELNYNKIGGEACIGDVHYKNKRNKNREAVTAESFSWIPSCSDDDNQTDAMTRFGKNSMPEFESRKEFTNISATAPPPPEYSGNVPFHDNNWLASAQKMSVSMQSHKSPQKKGIMFPPFEIVKTRKKKPRFTRHFHLYLFSVFLRLLLEIGFLFMQIYLYGFSVPEFYKCEQWPCPNIVDCFISRPMEKTIFLYFMLIYTCICVAFNTLEFKYLIWVYVFGRPKILSRTPNNPDNGDQQVVYDENGLPRLINIGMEEYDSDEEDDSVMENVQRINNGYACNDIQRNGKCDRMCKANSRYIQDKREIGIRELDMIMDLEDRDDFEIALPDPVDDIMQMEMGSTGGGNDMND